VDERTSRSARTRGRSATVRRTCLSIVACCLTLLALPAVGAAAAPSVQQAPQSLNLFHPHRFVFEDPNPFACTSASVMSMLNFVLAEGSGGTGFRWVGVHSGSARDAILRWERTHDTLVGGRGSDPHGWRNALNYFGWGPGALGAGSRFYNDAAYRTFDAAIKDAVRALVRTHRPIGMLARAGKHADVITGYYGLRGQPFARDASGHFTDTFTVGGVFLSDPFRSDGIVNMKVGYERLRTIRNSLIRFKPYLETDSPLDDRYTPGVRPSTSEWHGKFVLILPIDR